MSDIGSRLRLQREQNAARAAIAELTAQGQRLLAAYQQHGDVKIHDNVWERASAQMDVVKKTAGATSLLWLATEGKNAAAIITAFHLASGRASKCKGASKLYESLSRSLSDTCAAVCKQPRPGLSKQQNEEVLAQTQQLLLQDMQQRGTVKSREQALPAAQATLRTVLLAVLRSGTLQRISKLLSCSTVQLWPFCRWLQESDIIRESLAATRSKMMEACIPGVKQEPNAPMDDAMMHRMLMIAGSVAELLEAIAQVHRHAAPASSSGGSGGGGGDSGGKQAGAEGHHQDANSRGSNRSSGSPATTTSLSAELQSQLHSSGLLEHWSRLLVMLASARPPESMSDWVRFKCTSALASCSQALRNLGLDCSAQLLRPWQDSGPLQVLLSGHVVATCHALDRAGTCGLPEGAPCLPLFNTSGMVVNGGDRHSRPAVDVSLVLVALDSWAEAGRRAAAGECFGKCAMEGNAVRGSQGREAEEQQGAVGGGGEEGRREGGGGPGTSADAGVVERPWWSCGRGCKVVLDPDVLARLLVAEETKWYEEVLESAVERIRAGGEGDARMTAALKKCRKALQAEGSRSTVTTDSEVAAGLQGVHVPGRLATHVLCVRLLYGALSVMDMLETSAESAGRALLPAEAEADNAQRVRVAANGGAVRPGEVMYGPPGVSCKREEAEVLVVAALRCDREALRPDWSRAALRRGGGVWPYWMRRLAAWWRAALAAMTAGVRVGRLGHGGGGPDAAEPLPLFAGGELAGVPSTPSPDTAAALAAGFLQHVADATWHGPLVQCALFHKDSDTGDTWPQGARQRCAWLWVDWRRTWTELLAFAPSRHVAATAVALARALDERALTVQAGNGVGVALVVTELTVLLPLACCVLGAGRRSAGVGTGGAGRAAGDSGGGGGRSVGKEVAAAGNNGDRGEGAGPDAEAGPSVSGAEGKPTAGKARGGDPGAQLPWLGFGCGTQSPAEQLAMGMSLTALHLLPALSCLLRQAGKGTHSWGPLLGDVGQMQAAVGAALAAVCDVVEAAREEERKQQQLQLQHRGQEAKGADSAADDAGSSGAGASTSTSAASPNAAAGAAAREGGGGGAQAAAGPVGAWRMFLLREVEVLGLLATCLETALGWEECPEAVAGVLRRAVMEVLGAFAAEVRAQLLGPSPGASSGGDGGSGSGSGGGDAGGRLTTPLIIRLFGANGRWPDADVLDTTQAALCGAPLGASGPGMEPYTGLAADATGCAWGRPLVPLAPLDQARALLPLCANPRCVSPPLPSVAWEANAFRGSVAPGTPTSPLPQLLGCGRCGGRVRYCGRACQVEHWRAEHGRTCVGKQGAAGASRGTGGSGSGAACVGVSGSGG